MNLRQTAGFLAGIAIASCVQAEQVDLDVVELIRQEALENSQVMEFVYALTDLSGSRLTGSPGHNRAANAAVSALHGVGIKDAAVQPWKIFGRSWSYNKITVQMTSPVATSLVGVPMAWSQGTNGTVSGDVVFAPLIADPDDLSRFDLSKLAARIESYRNQYGGDLRGKIVMVDPESSIELPDSPAAKIYDEDDLNKLSEPSEKYAQTIDWPIWKLPSDEDERDAFMDAAPVEMKTEFWERELAISSRFYEFLADEGVVAVLQVDSRGYGGTIFEDNYGSWHPGTAKPAPTITLKPEHYNQMKRLLARNIPVTLAVNVDATFHSENIPGKNVIASIRGGTKRDEIVMIGGHLDSWHAATGATDNAAGCAVVMEAMRILKALDLRLDRTIRLGLWDGEEQNFYGSRAYVKEEFGDPITMQLKAAHDDLSAYFNLDGGSGKIRGIYLQGNLAARDVFKSIFSPLADLGVAAISPNGTYGTDHLNFDSVGLPGFQFVQDPLDYYSRTHHSDLDTPDHIDADNLKQAAAVLAAVVYHTANRNERMPRKPLPQPLPKQRPIPKNVEIR